MTDQGEIVFKCEASLWDMLAEEGVTGIPAKPFDMRRFDTSDDRIYRLSWGTTTPGTAIVTDLERPQRVPRQSAHRVSVWEPEVESITFLNKATDETLTRRYLAMEFLDWAPGWCFLILGERV